MCKQQSLEKSQYRGPDPRGSGSGSWLLERGSGSGSWQNLVGSGSGSSTNATGPGPGFDGSGSGSWALERGSGSGSLRFPRPGPGPVDPCVGLMAAHNAARMFADESVYDNS